MEAILISSVVSFGAGWFLCWKYFPRVEKVEHTVWRYIHDEVEYLKADAEAVVAKVEKDFANAGGEAKAHQALALLMKLRPEALIQDIRLAIEYAVRKL